MGDPTESQSRLDTADETTSLQFMSADFASAAACVSCHNAHPDSPRSDFQLDDMMGALVVQVPMDAQFAAALGTTLARDPGRGTEFATRPAPSAAPPSLLPNRPPLPLGEGWGEGLKIPRPESTHVGQPWDPTSRRALRE